MRTRENSGLFKCLVAITLVLLFAGKAIADSAPQPPSADIVAAWKQAGLQSLPTDIVAAWIKAGAAYGWISMQTQPSGNGISPTIPPPGAIPLFGFNSQYPWKPETISELPQPDHSFGLMLSDVKITDSGLSCLRRFTHLQMLALNHIQFTDAGLKELAGLTQLRALSIVNVNLSDADLKALSGLKQLQYLYLDSDQVTEAGLKQLAGLTQLRGLWPYGANVVDAGLKRPANFMGANYLALKLQDERIFHDSFMAIMVFSIIFGLLCLFEVWAFPKYRNFFFNHSNNINTKTFVFETYLRTAGFVFIALATVIIVLTLLHLILFVTSGHN